MVMVMSMLRSCRVGIRKYVGSSRVYIPYDNLATTLLLQGQAVLNWYGVVVVWRVNCWRPPVDQEAAIGGRLWYIFWR